MKGTGATKTHLEVRKMQRLIALVAWYSGQVNV